MRRDNGSIHLPTEILLLVAQFLWIWEIDEAPDDWVFLRQRAFHSFCLVSRQWYSVGIGFLYQSPFFPAGNSFTKFANTLCPPRGARKTKTDLGPLVKTLNMGGLVHHSTNSLTARLLSQTKKNLLVFVAPRVSFAVNCLPALSKCQDLRVLNLSLVSGTSIPFPRLKKAIRNLSKLSVLHLPLSMSVTHTDSVDQWPPELGLMTIGGSLDPKVTRTFEWPPSITHLNIRKCTDLSMNALESVLQNEQLRVCLRTLVLENSNEGMGTGQVSDVLYTLPSLFRLRIPADLTRDLLVLPAPDGGLRLPIRVLELSRPYFEADLGFNLGDEISSALSRNLSAVCALGVGEDCLHLIEQKGKSIERAVWKNIDKSDDEDLEYLDDIGLYTF